MALKEPNFLFNSAFGKWIQLKKNQICTQQQLPHLPPAILFSFLEETYQFLIYFPRANDNLLQRSCLENPRDGGAWWAAVYGVAQSQIQLKWLSSSSSSQALAQQIFSVKKQVAVPRFGFAGMWPWSHCLISAIVTQKQPQTWHMWTYWTRFQYNFTDGHTNVNFTLFSWVTQHGFSFGIFFNHLKMCKPWDFPGSSVVKTLHSRCRGHGFDPWSGN